MAPLVTMIAVDDIHWGAFTLTGSGTLVDLVAATTSALNAALLVRRPDHYKNFTVVGILLMAVIGGIAGGVGRDVIVNRIPAAFLNPAYITFCLLAGIAGYQFAYAKGELFREGLLEFGTSFALPWYAIVSTQIGIESGLPVVGALALAVIGPTAGRYMVDVTCGVPPKHFVRGEWFVATAVLTGMVWIACHAAGLNNTRCDLIAFVIGFTFRIAAMYRGWEEPLASEPAGVYQHADGRPLLGRKLSGKSEEELRSLGLLPGSPVDQPLDEGD